jgi:hypothetical protein
MLAGCSVAELSTLFELGTLFGGFDPYYYCYFGGKLSPILF